MATAKEHIKRLQRRHDFLKNRIMAKPDLRGISYDRAELASLKWAIETLKELTQPKVKVSEPVVNEFAFLELYAAQRAKQLRV